MAEDLSGEISCVEASTFPTKKDHQPFKMFPEFQGYLQIGDAFFLFKFKNNQFPSNVIFLGSLPLNHVLFNAEAPSCEHLIWCQCKLQGRNKLRCIHRSFIEPQHGHRTSSGSKVKWWKDHASSSWAGWFQFQLFKSRGIQTFTSKYNAYMYLVHIEKYIDIYEYIYTYFTNMYVWVQAPYLLCSKYILVVFKTMVNIFKQHKIYGGSLPCLCGADHHVYSEESLLAFHPHRWDSILTHHK